MSSLGRVKGFNNGGERSHLVSFIVTAFTAYQYPVYDTNGLARTAGLNSGGERPNESNDGTVYDRGRDRCSAFGINRHGLPPSGEEPVTGGALGNEDPEVPRESAWNLGPERVAVVSGGGGFEWQWIERDPFQGEGTGHDLRCVPYINPALDNDEGGSGGALPNPGTGMGLDGKMTCSRRWWDFDWSTTAQLRSWSPLPGHKEHMIQIAGKDIPVDEMLAPLIAALNRLGSRTVTSCQGSPGVAYIMFDSPRSAARFSRLWKEHLEPHGYAEPPMQFELRDANWRREVEAAYPFPAPIPVDESGYSYTVTWVTDARRLTELVPLLVAAAS